MLTKLFSQTLAQKPGQRLIPVVCRAPAHHSGPALLILALLCGSCAPFERASVCSKIAAEASTLPSLKSSEPALLMKHAAELERRAKVIREITTDDREAHSLAALFSAVFRRLATQLKAAESAQKAKDLKTYQSIVGQMQGSKNELGRLHKRFNTLCR